MRFKVVPPPRLLSFVRDTTRTLPLVPSSEDDCCAVLIADTDIDSRDTAREWITFLRALRLIDESDGHYYQRQEKLSRSDLANAFRERVYAVDEVVEILDGADGPLSAADVFERIQETVPTWEQRRRQDWERVWRERVRRILEWAVEFDLAMRSTDGYRIRT